MTNDRQVERLLDAWFADGPGSVGDRVIDDVAARISRTSQRPAWRLQPWRFSAMSTPTRIVALAGAVLATGVVGGALLFGGGSGPSPVPTPTPSPTATPSPTPTPPPLPDGRLDARDYVARATTDDPLAFTVTAPEGWSGFGGWAMSGPSGPGGPSGTGLAFLHGPQVAAIPCDAASSAPSPAPSPMSVDRLVAALSARTDLRVSGVTAATLAGYSGTRLDVQLPAQPACAQHYVFAEPQGFYAQGPANRWRVWALDVAGDTAIVVLSDFAATSAQDRAAAQAAIDSLRITH